MAYDFVFNVTTRDNRLIKEKLNRKGQAFYLIDRDFLNTSILNKTDIFTNCTVNFRQ